MGSPPSPPVQLIVLLLALVLSGVLISRLLGGSPLGQPSHPPKPGKAAEQQAQQAVDAASKADRQRLDNAMKALDPDARP